MELDVHQVGGQCGRGGVEITSGPNLVDHPAIIQPRLEFATEPAGCPGALDLLQGSYRRLSDALQGVRGAGKRAWQGWARLFADATADLYTAMMFMEEAADRERAAPLALYQARAASRSARRAEEAVRDRDVLSFDSESFGLGVEEYSPAD